MIFTDSNLKVNRIFAASVLIFSCVMAGTTLVGCGSQKEERTRLEIGKDGDIRSIIYEDFGENYYSLDELTDMAASEISYYNSEYISPKIGLEDTKVSEDGQHVRLVMTYNSALDYSHFNQTSLFFGTVQEAIEKGLDVSGALVDASGNAITEEVIHNSLDRHIIITTDKNIIVAPYKIAYVTKGVSITDNKEADLSAATADSIQLLLSK